MSAHGIEDDGVGVLAVRIGLGCWVVLSRQHLLRRGAYLFHAQRFVLVILLNRHLEALGAVFGRRGIVADAVTITLTGGVEVGCVGT